MSELVSDFDILTTTRAWVAVPWDFNSCIGLRFRVDGSGDMVFARLQIVRAEIKFRFSLQIPNELTLIYHDLLAWEAPRVNRVSVLSMLRMFKGARKAFISTLDRPPLQSVTLDESDKSKVVQYSLKEGDAKGETANLGPFEFYWTLSLDRSPFPDRLNLGVAESPRQFFGHNVNDVAQRVDTRG